MFTGIIEAVGQLKQIKQNRDGAQVTVSVNALDMSDVSLGDSIATNGVCLTVTGFGDTFFTADLSNETLAHTAFSQYKLGQVLNLEKALLPTSRLGGHIVSGHVDAVSTITGIKQNGHSIEYNVDLVPEISRYIAHKGSVTVDGISLTVNEVSANTFRLTIVPHTALQTTISQLQVGQKVNIEVDVVARYLERLLHSPAKSNSQTTIDTDLLKRSGFIK